MTGARLEVFTGRKTRARAAKAFDRFLAAREAEIERRVGAEIAGLGSPADVRRWQRRVRRRLAEILGELPARTPLRPRVTGRVERSDVTVEKVIFESRPGYCVTANLYIPGRHPLPAPGVLVPCGHAARGKGCRLYRETGLGLARKGYVAMVYDPTGQGERSECYDARTGRHLVPREVPQHHWTGKPCFLTGTTLAGYRTWDGVRSLDYLCSRREVDSRRIGVMGNSGGGAMTLLITAVDRRVRACAAGHPGGSMENTHLYGRRPPDRRLYSLIAPRPCRIIVGAGSGEEAGHRAKLEIMRPFYRACGCPERLDFALVEGVHDLKKPKREAAYEWLNRWLGRQEEGWEESPMRAPSERALWCTRAGQVQASPGGRTMFSLNRARARKLAPKRTVPKGKAALRKQISRLRRRVAGRIGFRRVRTPLRARTLRVRRAPGGAVEFLTFESEPGMIVPALLFRPGEPLPGAPLVIHAAEGGKPGSLDPATLPVRLWRMGYTVLSVDVRDTGETSLGPITDEDNWPPKGRGWRVFNGTRWRHDVLAARALGIGRSRPAMRALDVIRAVDLLAERGELAGRPVVAVGEGRGGIWALKAAAFDPRIKAVAAARTLAAYRLLVENRDYNQFEHFWVPGALLDYDVGDLPALVAPRPVWVLDPVDQMTRRLDEARARKLFSYARRVYGLLGSGGRLLIQRTRPGAAPVARRLDGLLRSAFGGG